MKATEPAPSRFALSRGECTRDTRRCAAATHYGSVTPTCCKGHIKDLMSYVGEICDELDVQWWADYGTLLGTVRNGGLIPHDKDADIGVHGYGFELLLASFGDTPWESAKTGRPRRFRDLHGYRWVHKLERNKHNRGRYVYSGGNCIKIMTSPTNRTNIDIFPWYERQDGTMYRTRYVGCDRFKGKEFHRDRLYPLRELPWEDRMVPVPAHPEWFCAHRYGAEWQTPIHANNDRVART